MLIIKSQDGGTFEYLGYLPNLKMNIIIGSLANGKIQCVGEYETEERTKEVIARLDHHIAAVYNDVNNQMDPIFTMPKEWEDGQR